MVQILRLRLPLASLLFLAGCGGGTDDYADEREHARQLFEQAEQSFQNGNAEEALELYDQAHNAGPVGRDRLDDLIRARAICAAKMGDLKRAEKEISNYDQVAGRAKVLILQSYILQKQGKMREAKAAFKKAKRLDRSVKQIKF